MKFSYRRMVLTLILAGLMSLQLAGCGQKANTVESIEPARVDQIDGSSLSQVTLTPMAAERLGVQTAQVQELPVSRNRTLTGEVIPLASALNGRTPPSGSSKGVAVKVSSQVGNIPEAPNGQAARVWPMVRGSTSWTAHALADDGTEDLSYVVRDAEGLVPGQRVGVELSLSTTNRMVVPYSSVLYDTQGATWVYTSPAPLTYVRHPVEVEFIEDDLAVLKEGPPLGTTVVAVGAIEIYGTESEFGN